MKMAWRKLNLKYLCIFSTMVVSTCVLFWRLYHLGRTPGVSTECIIYSSEPTERNFQNYSGVGCVFPEVNPYSDIAIKQFNIEYPKIVCEGFDWVECNMSECRVKQQILDKMKNIVCFYRDIIYVTDHQYNIADPVRVVDDKIYKLIRSDFCKVSCFGYKKNGLSILSSRWYGYKVGIRPQTPPLSPPKRNETLNILIVGFDSTSRSGFMLKLPKSYKVLTKELNAVLLKGYNIVGDGTSDALFPLLSGKTDIEHHPHAKQRLSKTTILNPDLFIFKTVKDDGYHAAYYEDMPWIGSFQYRYNGFNKQPADHYLRSFFVEEAQQGTKWYNGIKQRYCVGDTPTFLLLLNLTRQFMKVQGKRFCFTFLSDICHDDFNRLSTADDDLVDFLRYIKHSGYLENTMLIVMGDHGPRFGPWRTYRNGKVNERLPFMSIVLPEKLKRERPDVLKILKTNSLVLTTPFDIHTTMLDAMDLSEHSSNFSAPNATLKRGLSLLKPIPQNRTCEEARVTPHWCVCLNKESYKVETDDPMYQRSVDTLVQFINNITDEKRSVCALRNLSTVMWVTRQDQNYKSLSSAAGNTTRIVYYKTLIITTPGPAAFEASMQFDPEKNRFVISEKEISRITTYGMQPSCVAKTHPHLNKYCYCDTKSVNA